MLKIIEPANQGVCAASVCEACGGEFSCGATLAGCWCAEVKLSDEMRARLTERFSRCLCRACLERFAAEDEKQVLTSQTENTTLVTSL